jgi:hypothetical protein
MVKKRASRYRDPFLSGDPGDFEQKQLVVLLNSKRSGPVESTIRELFELMNDFEDVVRAHQMDLDGNAVDFKAGIPYLSWQGFSKSEATRFRRIAEIFDHSEFSLMPVFENGWSFIWMPLEKLRPESKDLANRLAAIQGLAQAGLLSLVRRCICGKWFAAKRTDQRFHSEGCRQTKYLKSDAGRATRRDYMRKWRADEKIRNENAKKFAEIRRKRKG